LISHFFFLPNLLYSYREKKERCLAVDVVLVWMRVKS